MTRTVTLALLITALTVGSVVLASMLPDMPTTGMVDGLDGRTDEPHVGPTCDLIGCCDDGQGACCYYGIEVGS